MHNVCYNITIVVYIASFFRYILRKLVVTFQYGFTETLKGYLAALIEAKHLPSPIIPTANTVTKVDHG